MAALKLALCCLCVAACINGMLVASSFTIEDDMFKLDGETLQIVSGRSLPPYCSPYTCVCFRTSFTVFCSFHYFRIHPAYWEDRLLRAKALGLNTIQAPSRPLQPALEHSSHSVLMKQTEIPFRHTTICRVARIICDSVQGHTFCLGCKLLIQS